MKHRKRQIEKARKIYWRWLKKPENLNREITAYIEKHYVPERG